MKRRSKASLYLFLVLAMLSLAIPSSAQETPVPIEGTLELGDERTSTLRGGERRGYAFNVDAAELPVDVVVFSPANNTVLYVYDDQGHRIDQVDRIGNFAHEILTFETADDIPAQIEVGFAEEDSSGEYTVSLLPTESHVSEQPIPGEQVKRWADIEVGEAGSTRAVTLPYWLYLPEEYDETESYPLMLFLHSSGARGTRLDFLRYQTIVSMIDNGRDYPFIIVSPQINYGETWADVTNVLASFIGHLEGEFPVDADRIYVTGQSLGGAGAWHFALDYPELPAAVVPMAGSYSDNATVPSNICDMAAIPTWAFHGEQDGLVPLAWEQALVDALTECGGDVQFTVYPGGGHADAFDRGYADPALYEWLQKQHR